MSGYQSASVQIDGSNSPYVCGGAAKFTVTVPAGAASSVNVRTTEGGSPTVVAAGASQTFTNREVIFLQTVGGQRFTVGLATSMV